MPTLRVDHGRRPADLVEVVHADHHRREAWWRRLPSHSQLCQAPQRQRGGDLLLIVPPITAFLKFKTANRELPDLAQELRIRPLNNPGGRPRPYADLSFLRRAACATDRSLNMVS